MGAFERLALVLQSAGKDLLRVCQQVARPLVMEVAVR